MFGTYFPVQDAQFVAANALKKLEAEEEEEEEVQVVDGYVSDAVSHDW